MANTKRIIEEVLSWGMGGLFIYAGVLKLMHPEVFLTDIGSYKLVGYRMAYVASFYLPALEIVAGLGLLMRRFRREAAWLLSALMLVFLIAITTAWLRGLDISCGCFGGAGAKTSYPLLVGRDLLIVTACFGVIYLQPSSKSNEPSH